MVHVVIVKCGNCTIARLKISNLLLHEKTVKHKKAAQSVVKFDSTIMETFVKLMKGKESEVKCFEIK